MRLRIDAEKKIPDPIVLRVKACAVQLEWQGTVGNPAALPGVSPP
jgi:hypothetical protein